MLSMFGFAAWPETSTTSRIESVRRLLSLLNKVYIQKISNIYFIAALGSSRISHPSASTIIARDRPML
jgi:hypothetical protein